MVEERRAHLEERKRSSARYGQRRPVAAAKDLSLDLDRKGRKRPRGDDEGGGWRVGSRRHRGRDGWMGVDVRGQRDQRGLELTDPFSVCFRPTRPHPPIQRLASEKIENFSLEDASS